MLLLILHEVGKPYHASFIKYLFLNDGDSVVGTNEISPAINYMGSSRFTKIGTIRAIRMRFMRK